MQKILIINTVPFLVNGISSCIINFLSAMKRNDLQIDIIINKYIDDTYQVKLEKFGCKIFILHRNKNILKYQMDLFKIIRNVKYDFVHVHGNSSTMILETFIAKILRVKNIAVHSHNTTCNFPTIHKLLQPIFLKTFNISIACGEAAGKWMFGSGKFVILNNGIDTEHFSFNEQNRSKIRAELGITKEFLIGHVGAFNYQKNHNFLLDVFYEYQKINPKTRLLLIGEGELFNSVKKKAKDLNIFNKIFFIGKTDYVNEYLSAMDLFVLPSRFEGFPIVLIEAQASGLPCIVTSNVDNNIDLTKNIFFADGNNISEWVNYIKKSSNSRLNRKNAFELINLKGFDIKRQAKILESIYRKGIK